MKITINGQTHMCAYITNTALASQFLTLTNKNFIMKKWTTTYFYRQPDRE
jgi:hypothetical protein